MRRSWIVGLGLVAFGCETDQLDAVRPVVEVLTQTLDFGAVPEGTSAVMTIDLVNRSTVPATITVGAIEGTADFTAETSPIDLAPQATAAITVTYVPVGSGVDEATLTLIGEALAEPVTATLRGGPIAPCIVLRPAPLDFAATSTTTARPFAIANDCDANLIVDSVAIDTDGNTDFGLRTIDVPLTLPPGDEYEAIVDYTKSGDAREGRVIVSSTDPDEPSKVLRLLPDPLRACQDGLDNDDDNLVDFPDDPGCTSRVDDDESNPPECDDGATESCNSDVGECAFGSRRCTSRVWGPCEGATLPVAELCDGLDNDCDQRTDEELTGTCMINGCAGARLCIEDGGGIWGPCQPVGGSAETCNGLDDDCNGTIDDGVVEACSVNMCMGTRICVPGGMGEWTNCQITTMPEICNGADDDCSGTADDNIADLTCGIGACARTAVACVGGAPNTCTPGTPGVEVCNGLDDDCDSTPDNNIPDLVCGLGICRRTVPACLGNTDNVCVPGVAGTEICNGLDDNCNGVPDEGVCATCGLMSTSADPQEPNNTTGAANPIVGGVLGTGVFDYDVTFPNGDTDWFQFGFTPPGSGMLASMTAEVTCVSWAGTGCGTTQPTVGLTAWYIDPCFPQPDDSDNGTGGLAVVNSSGPISTLGICVPQQFRLNLYPTAPVCVGEAINAHVRVTVTFQ